VAGIATDRCGGHGACLAEHAVFDCAVEISLILHSVLRFAFCEKGLMFFPPLAGFAILTFLGAEAGCLCYSS